MKARYGERLRRIDEKKRTKLLGRVKEPKTEREPDFIVPQDQQEGPSSIVDCSPELAFYIVSGERVLNLHDLAKHLEKMSDETFSHHVTSEKNDFSSWVCTVFGEGQLAAELNENRCRKQHHVKLLKHVVKDLKDYIQ